MFHSIVAPSELTLASTSFLNLSAIQFCELQLQKYWTVEGPRIQQSSQIRMMVTDHFMFPFSSSAAATLNGYDDPTHTVELTALSKSAEAEAYKSPPLEPPPNYDELDFVSPKPNDNVTE